MSSGETNSEQYPLDMPTREHGVALLMKKWQGVELTDEEVKVLHTCEVMGGVATSETTRHTVSHNDPVEPFSYAPIENPIGNISVEETDKANK